MSASADLIRSLYAAFGKGDVPTVLGAFDPRIRWMEAESFLYADRNPYVGPQAIAEGVFMRCVADVEGFSVTPERFTDGGETVVAEGRYRGTWKATGKPINAQFAHVWRLKGGKVVGFQQYTDTKQWAAAGGV